MKKCLILLMLAVMLVTLTSCKSIDYGTVISKSFTPAYVEHYIRPMRIGKTTICMPCTRHVSASWSIHVENEEGREWWSVSENYYNSVEIGDTVDRRK